MIEIVASYRILTQKMSVEETIDFVKSKRPQVHINPVQEKALKNFERLVKEGRLNICLPK